ncbi:hypothetical protein HOLleu_40560 [Holothuria leucospilota]|uniref:Uncharacterized protein n=1 Tax=Holothuria leucospilota TaxID=206669 RepID=A0A9Q0YDN0_HOLLE|nr:hypothetical protein HOLleu_40560 [Holothuria leucospilota]
MEEDWKGVGGRDVEELRRLRSTVVASHKLARAEISRHLDEDNARRRPGHAGYEKRARYNKRGKSNWPSRIETGTESVESKTGGWEMREESLGLKNIRRCRSLSGTKGNVTSGNVNDDDSIEHGKEDIDIMAQLRIDRDTTH